MTDDRPGAPGTPGAKVDHVVDERGSRIDVPDDSTIEPTDRAEAAIGATSPNNWWRMGLIAIAILALVLLAMQLFGGNPGTDVVPDTPVAAPEAGADAVETTPEPVVEAPEAAAPATPEPEVTAPAAEPEAAPVEDTAPAAPAP